MKYLAMIACSVVLMAAYAAEVEARLFQRRGVCSRQSSVQRTTVRQSGPVLSMPRAAGSCASGKCTVR